MEGGAPSPPETVSTERNPPRVGNRGHRPRLKYGLGIDHITLHKLTCIISAFYFGM